MEKTLKNSPERQIDNLWKMIGNTPFIAISYRLRGGPVKRVFVKCEQYNLTGSIKDRMALYILQKAYEQEKIFPGDLIVEASSGNTGIAFSAIGRALGHPVMVIMPDWLSVERRQLMQSYGCEVQTVSKEQGGFLGSIGLVEGFSGERGVFLPRQFENRYNVEAHVQTTGREIGFHLIMAELRPDAFVAGVGTGGSVMGIGKCLRRYFPWVRVHPLEPAESPTLSTGYQVGSHRIQGISDEFIPAIVDLAALDEVIAVHDGDAIQMAQKLSIQLGLGVGISAGANLLGAINIQEQMDTDSVVVTLFPDDNKRYLSTALFGKEEPKDHYLSPEVELLEYEVLK